MPKKPTIFISYNRADHRDTVLKIKERFNQEGFKVILDMADVTPGEDIKTFIQNSIRDSDFVLSLVSTQSLQSAWVSLETMNSFYAVTYADKKFIAAYTDTDFQERDFVDRTLEKINAKLDNIDQILKGRLDRVEGIEDLQDERSRYRDLKHHVDKIVGHLKQSYTVNIMGDAFEDGLHQIIKYLHPFTNEQKGTHPKSVTNPTQDKESNYLTNPPFDTGVFIGREKDLHTIESEYQQTQRLLILVTGEGGIGKTTLASQYMLQHANRYQYLAWLYADAGIGTALLSLKEKLGVQFEQDDDLYTQAGRIVDALNHLNGPCLLILDNANSEDELKKYYVLLHQLPKCHILLTSRVRQLANIKVHEVKPLVEAKAIELFKHYYPPLHVDELPILKDIFKAVDYNTLVAEILAKYMAQCNKRVTNYSLLDLLHELQHKGLLAVKNKEVELVYGKNNLYKAKPADIIAAMYDLTQLSENESYLLSNLSVLPAENISYRILIQLLDNEIHNTDDILDNLEEKGWIKFLKENHSFKISPVIQEVTRNKNANRLLGDCRKLVNQLTRGLVREVAYQDNYQQAAIYAPLAAAVILTLPSDDEVATLCQHLGNYYSDTGNLGLAQQAYLSMSEMQWEIWQTEPTNTDYKNGLAISYSKLGGIFEATGDWKNAFKNHEEYNRLELEIYESSPQNLSYKNGLAISYERLAGIFEATGDWKNAVKNYEQQLALFLEIYESSPQNLSYKNGLAISFQNLGNIYNATGDWKNAFKNYEEYNRLKLEIHESSPQNLSYKNGLAISYSKLGGIFEAMGDWKNAAINYEEYNRLELEIYESSPQNLEYKNNLAISYQNLGDIYNATGDWKNAVKNYEQQLALFLEIYESSPQNLSYKNGLAISYERLGGIFNATGDWKNAVKNYEEYNRLELEIYESSPQDLSYKNGLAISYCKLAGIYQTHQETQKAIQYFQQAELLWLEMVRDAPEYAQFKKFLTMVQNKIQAIEREE